MQSLLKRGNHCKFCSKDAPTLKNLTKLFICGDIHYRKDARIHIEIQDVTFSLNIFAIYLQYIWNIFCTKDVLEYNKLVLLY